ncbi:MAG TPA: hypothetical protein VIV35_01910 [Chitinophagaceae bacterium]
MTFKAPAPKIGVADLFTSDFWRYLFKALWLFFPGILILILGTLTFWILSQGKDIMLITVEQGNKFVFLYCILAVLLWTYVTWYTSRLVGKASGFQQPDENHIWIRLRMQLPRLMGFSCLTVVILAFLQLPGVPVPGRILVNKPWDLILLLLSIPYYFLIYVLWEKFIKRDYENDRPRYLKFLRSVRNTTALIMLGAAIAVSILQLRWGLIVLFLGMQVGLTLLLIIRRRLTEILGRSIYQQDKKDLESKRRSGINKRFWDLLTDEEDRAFSRAFLVISIAPAACYITTIVSVKFSVEIGSFPFTLLAFSVLLILGNIVAMVSVLARFNFHILFWALGFLVGHFSDPHKVRLIEKQDASVLFQNRQVLKEYFTNWVSLRYPNPDSLQKQPVYFVLANGGASRSGYWVASVLSRFEDSSHGKFSHNLFCLSGASGGCVGNATFFNILRNKKDLDSSCLYASRSYLKSDFLTYTLARMLGPDVFRYLLPFLLPVKDRGYALTKAIEEAPGRQHTAGIINMKRGMSEIITQKNQPANLPILCINTTRMQDGRPGVISTINMNEYYFNKRVDVLSLIDEKKDLKLSSAVVLGASFPYLSPAGRIDTRVFVKKDTITKEITGSQYFVDGGYFDNSGAGVVSEMIIGMRQLMKEDTFLSRYTGKLDFIVLHITNDQYPGGELVFKKINPLTNDLAAPLRTLVGNYGSQTSVNDSRLENYMRINFGPGHYTRINLYNENDKMIFPMNWVISKRVLDSMNARLDGSAIVRALWQKMNE